MKEPAMPYSERVLMFEEALRPVHIDIANVRGLASQGIPEEKGLRPLYWKILLRYLPGDRSKWQTHLKQSRELYKDWTNELIIDPHEEVVEQHKDHPLSLSQDSKWNTYFKDNEIMHEIDKDVKRTFPHLHFFNNNNNPNEESPHYHTLKRLLFIYAKLNPGIRYVQGMNEVLGPIYYCFATDSDIAAREHAEPDAFFCFTNLMSEVMNNFCKTLDKSDVGIIGSIQKLNSLLKAKDHELWADLEEKKLNPQFYSFRWITLLLSQEFDLPDVLRLWDSLFADPNRFDFLYYFCCAMLVHVREALLAGTFADNLKLLQSYPPVDFHVIFKLATDLHEHRWHPPPSVKVHTPSPPAYTQVSVTPAPPTQPTTTSHHLPSFSLPFSTKSPKILTKKSEDKHDKHNNFNNKGSNSNNDTELLDSPAQLQQDKNSKRAKSSDFKINIPLLGKLQL